MKYRVKQERSIDKYFDLWMIDDENGDQIIHREAGPAHDHAAFNNNFQIFRIKLWMKEGKKHREVGLADIRWYEGVKESEYYYLNGEIIEKS